MRKILLVAVLFWVLPAKAELIVVYNPSTKAVLEIHLSADSSNSRFDGKTILFFDETNRHTVPLGIAKKFLLVQGDSIVIEMNQTQKDSVDLAIAVQDTLNIRNAAKNFLSGFNSTALFHRALLEMLLEDLNAGRQNRGKNARNRNALSDSIRANIDLKKVDN